MQWYSVWSEWSGSRKVRCYAIQNIWGAHQSSLLITLHISHSLFDRYIIDDSRAKMMLRRRDWKQISLDKLPKPMSAAKPWVTMPNSNPFKIKTSNRNISGGCRGAWGLNDWLLVDVTFLSGERFLSSRSGLTKSDWKIAMIENFYLTWWVIALRAWKNCFSEAL
jgi:hypothetical protein